MAKNKNKGKKAEEHPVNIGLKYVAIGLMVGAVALLVVAGLRSYLQKNPAQAQQALDSLPRSVSEYIQENWDLAPGYTGYEEEPAVEPPPETPPTAVPEPTPDKKALAKMAVGTFESRLPSGRKATEAEIFTIKTVFPAYLDWGLSPAGAYEQTEVFITSVWEAAETGGRAASRDSDLKNIVQQAVDFSGGEPDTLSLNAALRVYTDLQKALATPNMSYAPTPTPARRVTVATPQVATSSVRKACIVERTQFTEVGAVIAGNEGQVCGYSPNLSKWHNARWVTLKKETRTAQLNVLFLSHPIASKGQQSSLVQVTPTPDFSYFQEGCGTYGCSQAP